MEPVIIELFIFIGAAIYFSIYRIYDTFKENKKMALEMSALKDEIERLHTHLSETRNDIAKKNMEICSLEDDVAKYRNLHNKRSEALDTILTSNLTAFPYLAAIIADYKTLDLDILAHELSRGNNVARKKKVAALIDIKKETKEKIEQCKLAEYQLEYLKTIFPTIDDILETDFRDLDLNIDLEDYDPVRKYVTHDEYNSLSNSERNQLALDRYINSRRKSKWQIGRDYELYIGYKYELSGYTVDFFGSYMGVEDLGRDLIAKKNDMILIIQCKYWSKEKTIHEKHIAQLYGTSISYCIENNIPQSYVKPIFITSTNLSDTAKAFCKYLNIHYKEKCPIDEFPRIKCNIGKGEYGEETRIYHLPMEQQYDKVKITKPGECFAFTVNQAEDMGFRRAYKWHSND